MVDKFDISIILEIPKDLMAVSSCILQAVVRLEEMPG
jgi:hypothetical protein